MSLALFILNGCRGFKVMDHKTNRHLLSKGHLFLSLMLISLGGEAIADDAFRVVYKLKAQSGAGQSSLRNYSSNAGVIKQKSIKPGGGGIGVLHTQNATDAGRLIEELKRDENVEYAELDQPIRIVEVPSDAYYTNQWALKNEGQNGGLAGIDIAAEAAWDRKTDSSNVLVGVVDTGIDYLHPDLSQNIWTNEQELNGAAGVDDDENGYIDDIHGYDAINGDGDPMDDQGHGSHVAGIIGAVGNNGYGMAGISWQAKMVACKALNSAGDGYMSDAAACLEYFAALKRAGHNIVVTNNSYTGRRTDTLEAEIASQHIDDILFVAAAGNDGLEITANRAGNIHPASSEDWAVITVGSLDRSGHLATTSNFGSNYVDIAAPGVDIFSTVLNSEYQIRSGTSMAAPHVTGALALLRSEAPYSNWYRAKESLLSKVKPLQSLQGVVSTGGLLQLGFDDRLSQMAPGDIVTRTNELIHGPIAIGINNEVLISALDSDGGSRDEGLVALDSTGKKLWSYQDSDYQPYGERLGGPTVTTDGYIYVSTQGESGKIHKLAPNGALIWKINKWGTNGCSVPHSVEYRDYSGTVGLDGGLITFCSGGVIAYDRDGKFKWRFRDTGISGSDYVYPGSIGATDRTGNIFFGSEAGELVAINRFGKFLWKSVTGATSIYPPAISGSTIIVAAHHMSTSFANGNVLAFDTSGRRLWSVTLAGKPVSEPILDASGNIYVATENSRLHKINANGSIAWSVSIGDSTVTNVYNYLTINSIGDLLAYSAEKGQNFLVSIASGNGAIQWKAPSGHIITKSLYLPGLQRILSGAMEGHSGTSFAYLFSNNDRSSDSWFTSGANERNSYNSMKDADKDGMEDSWEITNGLNSSNPSDALSDADSDGLSNRDEFGIGTLIRSADSDHDGLSDVDEYKTYNTNPLSNDSDNDGLSDILELNQYRTNPIVADTDLDGLLDGVEVNTHHTNPNLADTDADTYSDYDEIYEFETNPLAFNPPMADLSVTMAGKDGKWKDGAFMFSLEVTNWGPHSSENITLSLDVPNEVSFTSVTPNNGECNFQSQKLTCSIDSLLPNGSTHYSIERLITISTTDEKTKFPFTATVTSATYDHRTGNNTFTKKFGGSSDFLFFAASAFFFVGRIKRKPKPRTYLISHRVYHRALPNPA